MKYSGVPRCSAWIGDERRGVVPRAPAGPDVNDCTTIDARRDNCPIGMTKATTVMVTRRRAGQIEIVVST